MKAGKDSIEKKKEWGCEQSKRYSKPILIEYGKIEELTQTGGATTQDIGNLKRAGR
jgi:hypothetical protein